MNVFGACKPPCDTWIACAWFFVQIFEFGAKTNLVAFTRIVAVNNKDGGQPCTVLKGESNSESEASTGT